MLQDEAPPMDEGERQGARPAGPSGRYLVRRIPVLLIVCGLTLGIGMPAGSPPPPSSPRPRWSPPPSSRCG